MAKRQAFKEHQHKVRKEQQRAARARKREKLKKHKDLVLHYKALARQLYPERYPVAEQTVSTQEESSKS
jgi:hypothetical protein